MATSLSKIRLKLIVRHKGNAEAEVFRHLSPLTISELLRNLPMEGRIFRSNNSFGYINPGFQAGIEKSKHNFKRGEIGYMAFCSSLCFFFKDCQAARPVNPLGKVVSGLETLENTTSGDTLMVERQV